MPNSQKSRPPRARGLKQKIIDAKTGLKVAPPAGAWIETYLQALSLKVWRRAPRGRVD